MSAHEATSLPGPTDHLDDAVGEMICRGILEECTGVWESAVVYATLRWPVFPLHGIDAAGACTCGSACGDRAGKHPRTRNGLHAATTGLRQALAWSQQS